MRTGDGVIKTGNLPSPISTILLALRLLFFSEKALYQVFLNNRHTFNIVCLYVVTLFIPFKDMNGDINPKDMGQILESLTMTIVFIGLVFLYLPKKLPVFVGFIRLMLAFETASVFLPVTFLLHKQALKFFHPMFIGWYIALTVFAFSKIKGFSYVRSFVIVFCTFIITLLVPALF